mmetsp:Transcript_47692/g.147342  ORF Transcript_47692/g.147342 Transcript_47692/m.147342 type:complete len:119 (+) Transcript_47692:121-477(+)
MLAGEEQCEAMRSSVPWLPPVPGRGPVRGVCRREDLVDSVPSPPPMVKRASRPGEDARGGLLASMPAAARGDGRERETTEETMPPATPSDDVLRNALRVTEPGMPGEAGVLGRSMSLQ